MADGGGRIRTRTAMLEISWFPRSLEGADASFSPAMCVYLFFSWVARFFLLLRPRAHLVFQPRWPQKLLAQCDFCPVL